MCWRMKEEGHNVKMWIEKPRYREIGQGLIDIVDSYEKELNWCDFVICDDCGFGKIAEELRKKDYVVWGGTDNTDCWETERGIGQDLMQEAGLTTLPRKEFSNIEEAIKFVQSNPAKYVVKPDGQIQEEKSLTYVGKDESGEDMVNVLEHYKKWGKKISSFELQKKVDGIEVACSAFFNGKDFVLPIEVTFEHKKLMNDNIGPSTGEMGTSMIWSDKHTRLYKETIHKLIPYLQEEGYIGYFDINCIATDKAIYPLEITSRFGYPTNELLMETIKGDLGETYFEIASGANKEVKVSNRAAICVVIATPPFPYDAPEVFKKMSDENMVLFKHDKLPTYKDGIWPLYIKQEDDCWYLTGSYGYSLVVTGQGADIASAIDHVYGRIEGVIIPDMMYRTDIGANTQKNLIQLGKWGWL